MSRLSIPPTEYSVIRNTAVVTAAYFARLRACRMWVEFNRNVERRQSRTEADFDREIGLVK